MTITRTFTSALFVAVVGLAAAPVQAGQHRGGGGQNGGGHNGGGASRSAGASRGGGDRGATASRGGGNRGASASRGQVQSRSYAGSQSRSYSVNRGGGGFVRGGGVGYGPRYGGSRSIIVGRSGFYRPYYSFRPRLSLGFGLWAGYPVPYPYYDSYPYSYAYPYPADPYAYGYAAPSYGYPAPVYPGGSQSSAYPNDYPPDYPQAGSAAPDYSMRQPAPSVGAERGGQATAPGGVSFEITPDNAAVFVDGTYVGTAGMFGPSAQPLGLISGRHHIEIRASGYRTMTFDADVRSGQVIPYQGTLQRD
jgi:hypothetical protein